MVDEDRLELETDENHRRSPDQADLDPIVEACAAHLRGNDWRIGETVDLGGVSWRPHLQTDTTVVQVLLGPSLRGYIRKRLRAARSCGMHAIVVVPIELLYDFDVLRFLVEHEIDVMLLEPSSELKEPEGALLRIAYDLEVTEQERRELAGIAWNQCKDSAADVATKGRRLEGLLAFLLSQIDGLEIKGTNLITETEELDVVVRQRSLEGRSWRLQGAPLIIVEAKNWHTKKAGQKEFSAFYMKLIGKRQTVRLGIFVCTLGISKKAKLQELKGARDDIVVALLSPKEIESWVTAQSGDDRFEELVEEAMLR